MDAVVFFGEWQGREPGESRSLPRARALAAELGVLDVDLPLVTVVGSKGKGTCATYASATLAAAGLRVCTVTSPGLRGDRDRVRLNGRSVSEPELASLAERLERAISRLPPRSDGYLAPTGLFTLAGVLHARTTGADALVLEAGMGGRGDEVSLFSPAAVAITPIFGEHLGKLGDTPAEIATEKSGVIKPSTRAVVSAAQTPDVAAALDRAYAGIEYAPRTGLGDDLLPAGLGRANAEVGCAAALALLGERPAALEPVLRTVRLPGRLSWHRIPGAQLLADCAINRAGVAVALETARARWGEIDHAFVCLPDHKDLDGAIAELGDLPVTFVRLPFERLSFEHPLPPAWKVVDAADLTPDFMAAQGRHVVALGTVYFIAAVLNAINADTERLFVP
jgi:folylpolyglutamate synthase/dihydropteroate synthase